MDSQYKVIENLVHKEKAESLCISNALAYSVFSTLTAPLTTLGVTLQLSSKPLEKFYEVNTSEISKLELAKSHDLTVKELRYNELQLASGQVGTNKPFRAPYYKNYREVILALSAQGYQGFFKGNFIENLRFTFGLYPKYYLMTNPEYQELPFFIKFLGYFTAEYISEVMTQPLQNAHTRFILQNRIPEFRVYRSLYKMISFVRLKELMQGYNVILPRNSIFYCSFVLGSDNMWQNIAVTLGYFTAVYPLDTVQRRLEAQSTEHSMLPRRYKDEIRWTLSRIYHEEGIKGGLYRGFFCNLLANATKIILYPSLASLIWEKKQQDKYIKDGLELI